MCIIVDANSVHHVVKRTEAGKPVLRWLLDTKKRAGLVLGGELKTELVKAGLLPTLALLKQANRLHTVPDAAVEALSVSLKKSCKSNDSHVVALAVLSGCSIVFSGDKALHTDLKKHSPIGASISVYQNSSHTHLLTECKCPTQ